MSIKTASERALVVVCHPDPDSSANVGAGIVELCAHFLASPAAAGDFMLKFYSKKRLFSAAARTTRLEPDLILFEPAEFGMIRLGVKAALCRTK